MRRVFVAFLTMALFCFGISAAVADFRESKIWFNSLTEDQREDLQADLILLGFYNALVDSIFGPSTYLAISKFEASRLVNSDGVLTAADLAVLANKASEVSREFGFELVRDSKGQLGLLIPTTILPERSSASRGNSYSSPDGGIVLETVRKPYSSQSFAGLFNTLSRPSARRSITYATNLGNRFVISGRLDGKFFYAGFYSTASESVGFSISWTDAYRREGSLISTYLASHSVPLSYMKPEREAQPPPEQLEQSEQEEELNLRKFGSFILFDSAPDTIALVGDILPSSPLDFRRALKAQPDTTTVVLASDGGVVSSALIIAHTIQDMELDTHILPETGCYSACAFLFFAGASRQADGELGVHQMHNDSGNLVSAQTTLSDILEAMDDFGVSSEILPLMLRTPPDDMYIFSEAEIEALSINRGKSGEVLSSPELVGTTSTENQMVGTSEVDQVALLLEGSLEGDSGSTSYPGIVHWSRMVDETGQPTLVARASIPARRIIIDLTIKRNRDAKLPASHVMDIKFTLDPLFNENTIASLPGVLLKNKKLSEGELLFGASARVVENTFVFALSSDDQDVSSNSELMTSRKWLDLAIIYESGRHAIVTLEKKANAVRLFDEMFGD